MFVVLALVLFVFLIILLGQRDPAAGILYYDAQNLDEDCAEEKKPIKVKSKKKKSSNSAEDAEAASLAQEIYDSSDM